MLKAPSHHDWALCGYGNNFYYSEFVMAINVVMAGEWQGREHRCISRRSRIARW